LDETGRKIVTRITPLPLDRVSAELRDAVKLQNALLGLVPESLLTMAHRPRMAAIFAELASEVLNPATLDRGLKQLVAYVSSAATGCRYCQAHTAQSAHDLAGIELAKLQSAFEFETSPLFSEPEKAALRLARDGSLVPNEVTDRHFVELKRWYSDEQIVEIMGVIALFGWLNRWNDTMATTLEDSPRRFVERNLPVNANRTTERQPQAFAGGLG
jgi:uncharacterized peroxidase-related enzyme